MEIGREYRNRLIKKTGKGRLYVKEVGQIVLNLEGSFKVAGVCVTT